MSETISTAAGMDALPEDSVIRDPVTHSVWHRGTHLWFTAGAHLGYTSAEMMAPPATYVVLWRPDVEPARTNPTEEQVRQAIESALGPTWDSAVETHLDEAARAVLALLPPQRCAPSEEEIVRIWEGVIVSPSVAPPEVAFAREILHRYGRCAPSNGDHAHIWGEPWVGISGNRVYTCTVKGCDAARTEGGPGSTPKVGD